MMLPRKLIVGGMQDNVLCQDDAPLVKKIIHVPAGIKHKAYDKHMMVRAGEDAPIQKAPSKAKESEDIRVTSAKIMEKHQTASEESGENPIIQHFKQLRTLMSGPQADYQDDLLKIIKPVKVQVLSGPDLEYVKKIMTFKPKMKDCFMNAQNLVLNSDGRIKYVEGYYLFPKLIPIPFEHGWCKIGDTYFDPTQQFNGKTESDTVYVGREYTQEQVRASCLKTGMYGGMLQMEMAYGDRKKEMQAKRFNQLR